MLFLAWPLLPLPSFHLSLQSFLIRPIRKDDTLRWFPRSVEFEVGTWRLPRHIHRKINFNRPRNKLAQGYLLSISPALQFIAQPIGEAKLYYMATSSSVYLNTSIRRY